MLRKFFAQSALVSAFKTSKPSPEDFYARHPLSTTMNHALLDANGE